MPPTFRLLTLKSVLNFNTVEYYCRHQRHITLYRIEFNSQILRGYLLLAISHCQLFAWYAIDNIDIAILMFSAAAATLSLLLLRCCFFHYIVSLSLFHYYDTIVDHYCWYFYHVSLAFLPPFSLLISPLAIFFFAGLRYASIRHFHFFHDWISYYFIDFHCHFDIDTILIDMFSFFHIIDMIRFHIISLFFFFFFDAIYDI